MSKRFDKRSDFSCLLAGTRPAAPLTICRRGRRLASNNWFCNFLDGWLVGGNTSRPSHDLQAGALPALAALLPRLLQPASSQVTVIPQQRFTGEKSSRLASTLNGKELYPNDLQTAYKSITAPKAKEAKELKDKRKALKGEVCAEDMLVKRVSKRVLKGLAAVLEKGGVHVNIDDDAGSILSRITRHGKRGRDIEEKEQDPDAALPDDKEDGAGDNQELYKLSYSSMGPGPAATTLGLKLPGGKASKKEIQTSALTAEALAKHNNGTGGQQSKNQPPPLSADNSVILHMEKAEARRWLEAFSAEYKTNVLSVAPFFEKYCRTAPKYFLGLKNDDDFICNLMDLSPVEPQTAVTYTSNGIVRLSMLAGATQFGVSEAVKSHQAAGGSLAILNQLLKLKHGTTEDAGDENEGVAGLAFKPFEVPAIFRKLLDWGKNLPEENANCQSEVLLEVLRHADALASNGGVVALSRTTPDFGRLEPAVGFFVQPILAKPPTAALAERETIRTWFANSLLVAETKEKPFSMFVQRFKGSWAALRTSKESVADLSVFVQTLPGVSEGKPLPIDKFFKLVERVSSLEKFVEAVELQVANGLLDDSRREVLRTFTHLMVSVMDRPGAKSWLDTWGKCLKPGDLQSCTACCEHAAATQALRGFRVAKPAPDVDPEATWTAFVVANGTFDAINALQHWVDAPESSSIDTASEVWKKVALESADALGDANEWLRFMSTQATHPPSLSANSKGVTSEDLAAGLSKHAAWMGRMENVEAAGVCKAKGFTLDSGELSSVLTEARLVHKYWNVAWVQTDTATLSWSAALAIAEHIRAKPIVYHASAFASLDYASILQGHVKSEAFPEYLGLCTAEGMDAEAAAKADERKSQLGNDLISIHNVLKELKELKALDTDVFLDCANEHQAAGCHSGSPKCRGRACTRASGNVRRNQSVDGMGLGRTSGTVCSFLNCVDSGSGQLHGLH